MDIREVIERHNDDEAFLNQAFSINNEWRYYPLEAKTDVCWSTDYDRIRWRNGEDEYSGVVKSRPGHRKDGIEAILVDTRCDGNVYWMFFDLSKRQKWEEEQP